MAILAYDDVILREPSLLLPRGRRFTASGQYWGMGGSGVALPINYTSGFTLSCWFYRRAIASQHTIISVSKGNEYLAIFTYVDNISGEIVGSPFAGVNPGPSVSAASLNKWYHLATTVASNHWAIAVDGVSANATVGSWAMTLPWERFAIGTLWYGAGTPWANTTCDIAGVSVHNECLSPSHIRALANGAPPDKFPGYLDHWPLFANSPGFELSRNRKLRLAGTAEGSRAPDDIRIMAVPA